MAARNAHSSKDPASQDFNGALVLIAVIVVFVLIVKTTGAL